MPRFTKSVPKYAKHKASGQAIVTLDGKDFYLGPYGTRVSRREYDRLVGEWQQNGRRLPADDVQPPLSIAELLNAYRKFAEQYYRRNGKPTGTFDNIRPMLKLVRKHYGDKLVQDFGPLALKTLQTRLIESDASRRYINDQTARIKQMFKWAASNELVPFEVFQRLTTVEGLRKHRTEARESAPGPPIDDETVERTLPHLPPIVADMVRFQRLTGCRPGEVCIVRPCDIDTTSDVWAYQPESHKTEHHGRQRIIMIGPRSQEILRPYLLRDKQSYCFSPADSERDRLSDRHEQRVTPLKYGNRPGTNRKRSPKRKAGARYTEDSYRRAIHRACDIAFPPPESIAQQDDETVTGWQVRLNNSQRDELKNWQSSHRWGPNRLRHTHGTEVRKQFGLEAAQVVLGHSNAKVTQIYAERDLQKAAEIARQVG